MSEPYAEQANDADATEDPTLDSAGDDLEANEVDAAEQRRYASSDGDQGAYTRSLPEDADPADVWDQDREVQYDEDDDYR